MAFPDTYELALTKTFSKPLFGSFTYDDTELVSSSRHDLIPRVFFRLIAVTPTHHLCVLIRLNVKQTKPSTVVLSMGEFFTLFFNKSPLVVPKDLTLKTFNEKLWKRIRWFLPDKNDPHFVSKWITNQWNFEDVSFPRFFTHLCFRQKPEFFANLQHNYPKDRQHPPMVIAAEQTQPLSYREIKPGNLSTFRWNQDLNEIRIPDSNGKFWDFSASMMKWLVQNVDDFYYPYLVKFWKSNPDDTSSTQIPLCEVDFRLTTPEDNIQKLIKEGKMKQDVVYWTREVDFNQSELTLALRLLKQWAYYIGVCHSPDPIFHNVCARQTLSSKDIPSVNINVSELKLFVNKRIVSILSKTFPVLYQQNKRYPYMFTNHQNFWNQFVVDAYHYFVLKAKYTRVMISFRFLAVANAHIKLLIANHKLDTFLDTKITTSVAKIDEKEFASYQKNVNQVAKKQSKEDLEKLDEEKSKRKNKPSITLS